MSGPSQAGLWALALGGSLALHGAVALALVAVPVPEADKPEPTQISLETLPAGSVDTLAPALAVAPAVVEGAAPLAPSAVEPVAPIDVTQQAPVSVEPAAPVAVSPSDAVQQAQEPATEALPVADGASARPVDEVVDAPAATTSESASAVDDMEAVAPGVDPALELQPTAAEALAPTAAPSEPAPVELLEKPLPVAIADTPDLPQEVTEDRQEAPLAQTAPTLPTVSASTEIASVVEAVAAPTSIGQAETPATTAQETPVAVAPSAVVAVAPAVSSPAAAVAVSAPASTVAAAAPASPTVASAPVVAATVVETTAATPSVSVAVASSVQAIAPVEEDIEDVDAAAASAPVSIEEQIAMVVPDDVTIATSETPQLRDVPLADFLKSWEGEECILAIPTEAAAVEALSDTNASASALSEAYQRMTGVPVAVSHNTVTTAQCATLSFSRSIAQYPNYPLRLDLDRREIASGSELSGRISGLRKNTLYLFVVDDEGRAKLISQASGVTTLSVSFSEPLTLTDGPVSSAQLLIAIAADGPLRTVPSKPGVVAEEFFAALAAEIRDDRKPILYGITSFVVR